MCEDSTTSDKIDGIIFPLPYEDKIKCWDLIEQLIDERLEEYRAKNLEEVVVLRSNYEHPLWPESLTFKKEYSVEERKQNLIDVIKFAKANGNPDLKDNIIMWEFELKKLR